LRKRQKSLRQRTKKLFGFAVLKGAEWRVGA